VHVDGVHHLTLRVTDLEVSRRFYEGVLGLEVDQWWDGKCRLRLGDGRGATRLVLVPPLPGAVDGDRFDERRIGLDHVSLAVGDVDDLHRLVDHLRAAGVATEGVQPVSGGGHLVVCRDPDNVQVEFFAD
jgi:catechol 2,3-dioxygenase-like lactoylglutathione lyase family enzyme